MVQEIITYIILAATVFIAAKKLYLFFMEKAPSKCSSCFQAQSGCKVAHLAKQTRNK
jgi:hypothetical protein